MPSTQVTSVDHVLPPRQPYPPPGDVVPLSFFDTYWIALPPVKRLFLFPNAAGVPFPTLLQTLKSALSETLHLYYPLAGKLTYLPASGDVIVDCSPTAIGDGVAFTVAESDGDGRRLAAEANHNMEAFSRLVPELDCHELPAPVLAVQVTRFTGGGAVAVGYAAHHAVVDGQAIWRFVEAWARACRGEAPPASLKPATHDRAVIRYPKGDEIARRYLRARAPTLPQITAPSVTTRGRLQLTRRTFMIKAKTIKSLKQALQLPTGTGQAPAATPPQPPSTFVSLSAQAWISLAHSGTIKDDEATVLLIVADCRPRLHPPLDETYAGNCVRWCYARATGAELRRADGLARACMAIQRAIRFFREDPLRGCEDWRDTYTRNVSSARVMFVVGSPWFRGYEMDFGWGRPSRVELVSMNHDGEMVLLGGRERGEVQVSVSLSAHHMDAFASVFVTNVGLADATDVVK